jgi:GT2 family glycosyltransferase
MSTTIAVINWNSGLLLQTCIQSLLAATKSAEIIVIDNASTDTSLEHAEAFRDRVDFICNSVNRGFAAAINQAFHASSSSYLLVLNPDVTALPGSVQMLEDFMNGHPRAGAAGGYVGDKYLPRRFPSAGGLILENLGLSRSSKRCPSRNTEAIRVDQPAAAALMIRRDAYEEVAGFDEQFFPAWYEDVDFCRRVNAKGWDVFFIPAAKFVHAGGYSAAALGSARFVRAYYQNQLRYAKKHFGAIESLAVRLSVATGMIGRMVAQPGHAGAYGRALLGALKGW